MARLMKECAAAGTAGAIADGVMNPSTVLQVRGQLEPSASMLCLARRAVQQDGVIRGLWMPGLVAICLRASTYSGVRVGFYPRVRDWLPGDGFATRVFAGTLTGGVGGFLFAPAELVRVRMVGPKPFSNTWIAFASIAHRSSLAGLWQGASWFSIRCGCFSGSQLATYDSTKRLLLSAQLMGAVEDARVHFVASCISGMFAQVVCHPLDTIKTLVMQNGSAHDVKLMLLREFHGKSLAHDLTAAMRLIPRLYGGLLPALLSRGPMVMIFLPLTEQVRVRIFGLDYI